MAEFEVHKYNQAYMSLLGIHSYKPSEPTLDLFKKVFPYYAFLVTTFAIESSFMFIINSHETKDAIESFKIVAGGFQSATCFFVVGFQLEKIKILHLKLQGIADDCKDEETNNIYWKSEQKCRKYTLRIGLYVIMHTLEFGFLLAYALVCIAFGVYTPSSWPLFFKLYLPFDEYENILNWFIAWFLEFNLSFAYSIVMTSVTSYFVSCSIFMSGMCDHFNLLMQFIERNTTQELFGNHSENMSKLQVIQLLTKAIQLHVKTIE